jgi:hypothetical protein
MTAQQQADSLIWYAEHQGYDRITAIEMAKFATDKVINYGQFDRITESFWFDVMDNLENR